MRFNSEALEEIKKLEDRRGRLTAEEVLEAARPSASPLHGFFEWDDSKAAEAHRLEQARDLIRRVKIELEFEERVIQTPRYVKDPGKGHKESGYISILKVNRETARDIMKRELETLGGDLGRVLRIAQGKQSDLPVGFPDRVADLVTKTEALCSSL